MNRISVMGELRSAMIPENLNAYVSALSGFSQQAIEKACVELEQSPIADYEPRFPALGRMVETCRKAQISFQRDSRPRYFCADCESESGLLFFDAPSGGNRLRGTALVDAPERYARPCTCGGTELDWRTLVQDRAARPERYFALADVVRDVNRKRVGKEAIQL